MSVPPMLYLPLGFPSKIMYIFLVSLMLAVHQVQLILLELIARKLFCENYN